MLVSRILTLAARAAGISGQGQQLSQDMTQTAFDTMNAMIGQWAAKRWLIYHLVTSTVACTGATSYTVGAGQNFNISPRPTTIDSAFVSMRYGTSQQIDIPLEILLAREDYNRIALKSLVSFPEAVYYDNAYPYASIYPWPIPNTLYQLTITAKMPLPAFADLAADINLPAEYQEALVYNLAVRLRAMYQLPIDPAVIALARAALGTVRAANTQLARLQIPAGMGQAGRFNIYSGQ